MDIKDLVLKRSAFLIIDMQNDFVSWTANANVIRPKLKKTLDICRANNIQIIHVIRHYNPDGSDVETPRIETFKKKPFVVVGTPGAEIVAELLPWEGEPVIIKKRWSAFFKTDLLMLLNEKGIDTIVVGGIFTPNCVRATVYDAIAHDLDVIVLADGTASTEMDVQDANILDMINIGVKIISCEEFQRLVEWKSKV